MYTNDSIETLETTEDCSAAQLALEKYIVENTADKTEVMQSTNQLNTAGIFTLTKNSKHNLIKVLAALKIVVLHNL